MFHKLNVHSRYSRFSNRNTFFGLDLYVVNEKFDTIVEHLSFHGS